MRQIGVENKIPGRSWMLTELREALLLIGESTHVFAHRIPMRTYLRTGHVRQIRITRPLKLYIQRPLFARTP
jgi:hypothetical protein